MGQEIERKYLVQGGYKEKAFKAVRIVQGYLCSVPERTVRIRIKGEKGYITVKGACDESGVIRFEWEKEIPVEEAEELMALCEPGVIDKTRYMVKAGTYVFEVDEFYGKNEGLVLAEIELPDEQAVFESPSWLGKEVTGDIRYYNSMLVKHPFKEWEKEE